MTVHPTRLTLVLPEPPTLNRMIDLAKERTRKSRTGGWMKRSLPVVYDQQKEAYELSCLVTSSEQRIRPPAEAWQRWRLERALFRLHQLRDPVELLAGLKWPIDWLVHRGFVVDDGPEHLLGIPHPEQVVDRAFRSVTLEICEA